MKALNNLFWQFIHSCKDGVHVQWCTEQISLMMKIIIFLIICFTFIFEMKKTKILIFSFPWFPKYVLTTTLLFLLWGEGWWNGDHMDKLFLSVVSLCAHYYASLSLVGRGVVKWRPHWEAFPFSCLPVDMLKLKLGELFNNIFVVFSLCCHHWQLRE
jgi:hypothetical protein